MSRAVNFKCQVLRRNSLLAIHSYYKWQHNGFRLLDSVPRLWERHPFHITASNRLISTGPDVDKNAGKSSSSNKKDIQDKNGGSDCQKGQTGKMEQENVEEQYEVKEDESSSKPVGLFQRFKQTYKEYGIILIGVHVFTSSIWAASFYYAAASGIHIVPLLKALGASDKIIAPLAVPGAGHVAVAYLMYKLATPLRYTVTIAGTRTAVKVLRRWGYLPPIPENNRIRSLVKEGQKKVKEKYEDIRKNNKDSKL